MIGKTKGNSIQKAPVLLWKKEDSARGRLARENPEAAIAKYAVGNNGLFNIGVYTNMFMMMV